MKFKSKSDHRELVVLDKDGGAIKVEVEGKYTYIMNSDYDGVRLTRAKALKFAWAIINELDPSVL
ncbi:hypothetical protein HU230_0012615 [Bradyrhizobium quebecense]|uniref:Uncharacterized protein n=1 Tax=Bradyrhizobium quebecense TaxID=2748629 RepID=A0A973WQU1_9BRAD|nr:hypothetical protein [Bradyrhizobium quebecense]UGA46832.1 hypothetical protein HU230_0012615 [Bradyrhizobium quebecense]